MWNYKETELARSTKAGLGASSIHVITVPEEASKWMLTMEIITKNIPEVKIFFPRHTLPLKRDILSSKQKG